MSYADYAYYTSAYLLGRSPLIPEEDFLFWEKRAGMELDAWTFDRLKADSSLISDDVRDCACAITEMLYKADQVASAAESQGLAGPLTSWSNDGNSGSIDVSQSIYTESGKKAEVRRLIYLYLGNTGLLYAGVMR